VSIFGMDKEHDFAAVARPGSFVGTAQQLAQLIYDQVATYPEHHDQNAWVTDRGMWESYGVECGTTMCVAGWASWFTEGFVMSQSAWTVGRKALGLDHDDAARLFYGASNEQAKSALKALANGERIDWQSIQGPRQ